MNLKVILIFLSFAAMVSALSIDVGIEKSFSGEIKETSSITQNGVIGYNIEFLNTGSLPYRAMSRLDIFEDGKIISTSWSDYSTLSPGDRSYMNVYGNCGKSGKFDARIRIYYANEIMEKWHRNITIQNPPGNETSINITSISYGTNFIDVAVTSDTGINSLVVTADSDLPGWILHEKITGIQAGKPNVFRVYFEPDVYNDNHVYVKAFGLDGKSFSSGSIEIVPKKDVIGALDSAVSGFISFISSFFP